MSQETKMSSSTERNTASVCDEYKRDGCTSPMSPSNYMKESVQFPQYKPENNQVITYDIWCNRASKSTIEKNHSKTEDTNTDMFKNDVKMFLQIFCVS